MKDNSAFDAYLEIDKSNLDDELLRFPTRFREVSDAVVELEIEKDRLKFQLMKLDATIAEKLRKDPKTKITEAWLSQQIILNPQHQAALTKYEEVKRNHDLLSGTLEAMRFKSKSVVKLVDLYMADYFAPDSGPSPMYRRQLKRESG